MKTVFMTGEGGGMGFESFRQILPDIGVKYNLVMLLRDSEKNRNLFAPHEIHPPFSCSCTGDDAYAYALTVLPVFAEETGNAITVIFDLNTTPDLTDNETYVYTTTGYDEYWQPVETQSEAVFTTEDGVLAVDLPIPTREGWYFAGWQTKPDVTESDLINGVSPYLWIPGHKTNFLGQALQAQDETTGMENTVVQLTVSFLTVAVYVGIRQGFVIRVPIEAWPWIIVLGIVNTGIGCYLYFSPLSKLPVQTVAICGYLEPLSAVVFASLLLGEKMTALQIIGAACIIGGAMIGELLGKKE